MRKSLFDAPNRSPFARTGTGIRLASALSPVFAIQLLLNAQPSLAQGMDRDSLAPVGGEFQINEFALGDEGFGHGAMAADGSFVLVWDSCDPDDTSFGPLSIDGSGCGVAARAYDAVGNPVGQEFIVNQHLAGLQGNPSIGMDHAGNFVVAWQSHDQDSPGSVSIYARRFGPLGVPLPPPPALANKYGAVGDEFRVNNGVSSGVQRQPVVAMARGGEFVVVWDSFDLGALPDFGRLFTIQAHRFDKNGGSLGEFQVNVTPGRPAGPSVAMADEGAAVIVWSTSGFLGFPDPDGDATGVYAMLYDAEGNEIAPTALQRGSGQGNERQINSTVISEQYAPSVAMMERGDFVIAWLSRDTGDFDILAKRFGSLGNERPGPQGATLRGRNEFEVNTFKDYDQVNANVGVDDSGRFAIAWASNGQDADTAGSTNGGVFAKVYDAKGRLIPPPSELAGTGIGGELQVNTTTFGNQRLHPGHRLTMGHDRIVVPWSDGGFLDPDSPDGHGTGYFGQIYRIVESD